MPAAPSKASQEQTDGKVRTRENQAGVLCGHRPFLHTTKNKKTMPEKMEIKKFDPKARAHVMYKEAKIK